MTIRLSLEDRAAIEDLIQRHAWLIDNGKSDGIGDLFTEDAAMFGVGPDKVGRAAIAAWGADRAKMKERRSRHVQSNILIEPVSPGNARGSIVLTVYRHDGTGPGSAAPLLVCEYTDSYRHGPDGVWRFAERRLSVLFGEV